MELTQCVAMTYTDYGDSELLAAGVQLLLHTDAQLTRRLIQHYNNITHTLKDTD